MNELDNVEFFIKKASLLLDRIINKKLKTFNITISQLWFVHYLMIAPHPVKQVDIEKFFSMKNPTVTGILENLEKKGLIKREKNPNDARSKIITLTPKSKEIQQIVREVHDKESQLFRQYISLEEKETLGNILRKVISLEEELEKI